MVWPIKTNGEEGQWRCSADYFRELLNLGYARVGEHDRRSDRWSLLYLGAAQIARIENGEIAVVGRSDDGSVQLARNTHERPVYPVKTVWNRSSHRSGEYGTKIISALLPTRRFPFAKSLYAEEDAIRIAVASKPNAVVLDFFAGSGTTAHAVMRLNKQDGGQRQSIMVTNNEVGQEEATRLRREGLRPGDLDWEQHGIADWITWPRVKAAITGNTPDGTPIRGDYKFIDEFPMADGFEANAEFFRLTYESPLRVATDRDFERIAPLLWLRAGARGRRIDTIPPQGWDVAEYYGVVRDLGQAKKFIAVVVEKEEVHTAFVITDDDRLFQAIVAELPERVEPVRLYEAYLRNFEIETARSAL